MAVDTSLAPKACRHMNVQRSPDYYRGNAQRSNLYISIAQTFLMGC